MFCVKCGSPNDDNAWKCVKCGQALEPLLNSVQDVPIVVHNYMAQAILVTLSNLYCCCFPFGIVAIIFASQVNSKVFAGDIDGARASSRKAKLWCWIAFGVGLLGFLIFLAIRIIVALPKS